MHSSRVLQDDLFAAPKLVGTLPRSVQETPKKRVRQNRLTQLESETRRKRSPRASAQRQIVLSEIQGSWKHGRTRQEIADRTGIKLQTVCGVVNRLIHDEKKCWEPVIGYEGGRPVHWKRDNRAVVVDVLYQPEWDLSSATERIV